MKRTRIVGLLIAGLLTACSSTMPQSASNMRPALLPTVTPEQPTSGPATPTEAAAAATAPAQTATAAEGPVTEMMAALNLSGERYAALGDPKAAVTIVEFSDYG